MKSLITAVALLGIVGGTAVAQLPTPFAMHMETERREIEGHGVQVWWHEGRGRGRRRQVHR